MWISVRGGTANGGEPSLCLSCRWATIVKGSKLHEEIIECGELFGGRNRITFPVTSCTAYSDRRRASLRDMEEIAWVLRSDPRRKDVGFVPARGRRAKERLAIPDINDEVCDNE